MNTSLKTGFELIITKYSAVKNAKTRIIDIVRKIAEGVNEYTKTSIGREILDTSWVTTPATYRVRITIKRDIDPEAKIEIINEAGIKLTIEPKNREARTELAKGAYMIRLVSRGIVYAQKRIEVYKDNTEVEITPKETQKNQGKNMIRIRKYRESPIKLNLGYRLSDIIIGFRDPSMRLIYISLLLLAASIILQILSRII
jgi:hypothetical protein